MKTWHLIAFLALAAILNHILPSPKPAKPPFFTTY